MLRRSNFKFFWKNSPFSQWSFYTIEVDGVKYNCNEQYMMAQKALLFNDTIAYQKIMQAIKPLEQKALGRTVVNFDQTIWDNHCLDIVFSANWAKFTQHPEIKEMLLETGDRILAEASPYDTIWGIGMGEFDAGVCDPKQWKGKNWLGETLMKVRAKLREECQHEWELYPEQDALESIPHQTRTCSLCYLHEDLR